MTDKPPGSERPRMAGGIFIFFGLIIGAIAGVARGQASAGMVAGLVVGSALALVVWLIDRNRANKG
jgi:uncharacterized membrane protein (UPF0136 family)